MYIVWMQPPHPCLIRIQQLVWELCHLLRDHYITLVGGHEVIKQLIIATQGTRRKLNSSTRSKSDVNQSIFECFIKENWCFKSSAVLLCCSLVTTDNSTLVLKIHQLNYSDTCNAAAFGRNGISVDKSQPSIQEEGTHTQHNMVKANYIDIR